MAILSDSLKRQLETPAVYAQLIFFCFELFTHTAQDIEKHWMMGAREAYALGVRSTPSLLGNLLASESCVEKFGADTLTRVPGFYPYSRTGSLCNCLDWRDNCICDRQIWRLDIDPFPRGLIVPERNERGWFTSLKIFRHARDQKPFRLKVRRETAA
jgi:hypothetical protein